MAAYNKFNSAIEDLLEGINAGSDTFKVGLTNTSPNVADTHVDTALSPDVVESTSNAVEAAAGSGYTEGGNTLTITTASQSGGTYTLAANQTVWTATGAMAAFRYAYLYDNTAGAAATRPVVAWWDYGASLSLINGETFTVQFNSANPGTIFTAS